MIVISLYFFSDLLVLFGQLDRFILPWEEVLFDGFDLAVLNPSDRRGHAHTFIVDIKDKMMGFIHE